MTERLSTTGKDTDTPMVLIVDDEPAIVDLLASFLEDEGFEVEQAADGEAALNKARHIQPDLIIADVMMPRMDGYELVDELAAVDTQVPVIMMSAAVISRRADVPFIAKPFDLGELLDMISVQLGQQVG